MQPRTPIGIVTGGSFNEGLQVRMNEETSSESLQIGDFCVVEGEENLYFCLIQDLALQATDGRMMAAPPDMSPFVRRILRGTGTYVTAEVKPLLMVPRPAEGVADAAAQGGPHPVRTIPMHFAHLVEAAQEDFASVFGEESASHFAVGQPLTMDMAVPINLEKLVERSTGVFGSTGTGKSFLTRLLLCGIIKQRAAVNLVFDMHNEYAVGKESEDKERVKGLRELFPAQVVVYTLDPKSVAVRADHNLVINLDEIESGDVLALARELRLSSDTVHANLDLLERELGRAWLRQFAALAPDEVEAFTKERGGHSGSLRALQQRLRRLVGRDYVKEHSGGNVFQEMMGYLDRGKHVILHFGKNDEQLDQIIVANMVTRRIRELYQAKTERYQQSNKKADRPRPLVITVEEAHRFLNPEMARQTIFGTIARELRKYYVTLLIVDQRPSGIDDEILSQVGTRISGKLMDERDLDAVLSGVANRSAIRAGLAGLDTKQQVMLFGHAIPMPIALRTRRYDAEFYRAMMDESDHALELHSPEEGAPALHLVPHHRPPTDPFEQSIDDLFGGDS